MTALTKDRNTPYRTGEDVSDPVAAATKIYAGSLVVLDASGNAAPGSTATGLKARGRAEENIDNSSGVAGDVSVAVRRGTYKFANDGSINRTHIDATVYIVDDQTLAATDGTGTRSAAGKLIDVEADGVWVEIK
ncbi:MAG: hypothetical protein GQ532_14985 [Methylomarinum sp.]|nr:hypothetical protein [Methylomarinum sp.]